MHSHTPTIRHTQSLHRLTHLRFLILQSHRNDAHNTSNPDMPHKNQPHSDFTNHTRFYAQTHNATPKLAHNSNYPLTLSKRYMLRECLESVKEQSNRVKWREKMRNKEIETPEGSNGEYTCRNREITHKPSTPSPFLATNSTNIHLYSQRWLPLLILSFSENGKSNRPFARPLVPCLG